MDYKEMDIAEVMQVVKLHNELDYFIQKETKDDYWDFDELDEDTLINHLKGFINHPEKRIFVAKVADRVIGFIASEIMQCYLNISKVKRVGYICAAYVSPEYRGKGIMKKLDSLVLDFFKSSNVKFSELHFMSRNQLAEKCWISLGYVPFRAQARKRI